MSKLFYIFFLNFTFSITVTGQTNVTIKDGDLQADTDYTWTNDNTYLLDGYVFLESGGTLNIEQGTVIKGLGTPTTSDKASALIITKGAKIIALGSKNDPIIFTAEFDDTSDPGDLDKSRKGLWGGLIILGNAPIGVDGGKTNIEGIPSTEGRAEYGGDSPEDNSGIIRYISIRHGGAKLEANNEINGLTLGGVGNGTTIDYVEVFANLDDGIEWFGGNVNVKHAVVSYCGDDSFDYDQSWNGKGQFWFTIQDELSNRAGEWDGSEKSDLTPKAIPVLSNITAIGAGGSSNNEDGNDALRIRDDAAVQVWNSVFTDFADRAIRIDNDAAQDSYKRLVDGEIAFKNNIFSSFGAGNSLAEIVIVKDGDGADVVASDVNVLLNALVDSRVVDPKLGGVSRSANENLDPRINIGSEASAGAEYPNDDFFEQVPFRGAFGNTDNWADNWTALSEYGHFGNLVGTGSITEVTVKDGDINANDEVTWTADKIYLLDGYIFVEAGANLTIQPGTVIKGLGTPSAGDNASALIITKGAKIHAVGTAQQPIIFTAELDDTTDPEDLDQSRKGLWGGLIILGDAPVGVDGDKTNIEGIPSTEGRAEYGGSNPDDNSGELRYVSIRHGGAKLEANNEINGLTLGGVGKGTRINYVEVFANLDDGIEWFGGNVSIKHAVVSFCGDDSFDYDQSWNGKGQFWFTIQDDLSNRAGEWDGSEKSDLTPKAIPILSNITAIGAGEMSANEDGNDAMRIRDDAAVKVWSSIFTDFPGLAIRIDNDAAQDSYKRLVDGDIAFKTNVFFNFGVGSTLADIAIIKDGDGMDVTPSDASKLQAVLADSKVEDPQLAGISRSSNGGLDPRPNDGSPALSGAAIPDDAFFSKVDYKGAFANADNWAETWTALGEYGFFGDLVSVNTIEIGSNETGLKLSIPAPNPIQNISTVELDIPVSTIVSIQVYDMAGRKITEESLGNLAKGTHQFQINSSLYKNGVYIMALMTSEGTLVQKFSVVK